MNVQTILVFFLLLLGCLSLDAQPTSPVLLGIRSGLSVGYFKQLRNDFITYQQFLYPNSSSWPPARHLLAYGRYGSEKVSYLLSLSKC